MFKAPNRSVPESHLIGHLKRNEIGEMEEVEKLAEFGRPLGVGVGLAIGLAVEDDEFKQAQTAGGYASGDLWLISSSPFFGAAVGAAVAAAGRPAA